MVRLKTEGEAVRKAGSVGVMKGGMGTRLDEGGEEGEEGEEGLKRARVHLLQTVIFVEIVFSGSWGDGRMKGRGDRLVRLRFAYNKIGIL